MVYFHDAQVYMEQSILLLQARPTTTRISTRYSVTQPPSDPETKVPSMTTTASDPSKPRAILILKTYDPVSGTCLKYRTNKAAEIGRLVSGLQRCARVMAAVPQQEESAEIPTREAPGEAAKDEAAVGVESASKRAPALATGGGGVGGKKKKKGKK